VLKGSPFGKARYLSTLKMMYQFLNKVRKEGLLSVEMDVEKPKESSIFQELSRVSERPSRAGTFSATRCGQPLPAAWSLRHGPDDGAGHGGASPRGDRAGERIDHRGGCAAGLGIVAAVLGVVITMGSLGGPPEEIGEKWQRRWWARSSAFCFATE